MCKLKLFGFIMGFSMAAYAEYSHEEISNTYGKVYQDGRLLATLNYSFGWKVICENKRVSGDVGTLYDSRQDAIQAAIAHCRN